MDERRDILQRGQCAHDRVYPFDVDYRTFDGLLISRRCCQVTNLAASASDKCEMLRPHHRLNRLDHSGEIVDPAYTGWSYGGQSKGDAMAEGGYVARECMERAQITARAVEVVVRDNLDYINFVEMYVDARGQGRAPAESNLIPFQLPHPPQPPPPHPPPPPQL